MSSALTLTLSHFILYTLLFSFFTSVIALETQNTSYSTESSPPVESVWNYVLHQLLSISPFSYLFTFILLSPLLSILPYSSLSSKKPIPSTPEEFASLLSPKSITHYQPTSPSSSSSSYHDVIIVGAGVAGAALSATLGRRGYNVRTIEFSLKEPHRIVGELLQPGGVKCLQTLQLEDILKGFDAQVITGYTIILNNRQLLLKYPYLHEENKNVEGRSFHNGRLLTSLRKRVEKEGKDILIEGKVTELLRDGDRVIGVKYTAGDKTYESYAALVVVADGNNSTLRRPLIANNSRTLSSFLGLILTDCTLPTANNGHVILADPTPILAYPISSTEVRMLIDIPTSNRMSDVTTLKQWLKSHILPQLPQSMQQSFLNSVDSTERFPSMGNQSLPLRPTPVKGVLLIGDAVNMRHPLTGGGMTVAFNDICNIHRHIATMTNMNDFDHIDKCIKAHYDSRNSSVKVINILADALYSVFCQKFTHLRLSCYNYLSRGGICSEHPVELLSGMSSSQFKLLFHFFSVALFGFVTAFSPPIRDIPNKLDICNQMVEQALDIIIPLIIQENDGEWGLVTRLTGLLRYGFGIYKFIFDRILNCYRSIRKSPIMAIPVETIVRQEKEIAH